MPRLRLIAIVAALFFLAACSRSAPPPSSSRSMDMTGLPAPSDQPDDPEVSVSTDPPFNTLCPVTNDPIDPTVTRLLYHGKVYGFCCDDCPPLVQKKSRQIRRSDPMKFAGFYLSAPRPTLHAYAPRFIRHATSAACRFSFTSCTRNNITPAITPSAVVAHVAAINSPTSLFTPSVKPPLPAMSASHPGEGWGEGLA